MSNNKNPRHQDRGLAKDTEVKEKAKHDWLGNIPPVVKSIFIKFWFAGIIYFFLGMGLGVIIDPFDMIFVLGVVLGAVLDLAINRILKAFDDDKKGHMKYVLLYNKKFYFLILNIIYGMALSFAISYTYVAINQIAILAGNLPKDTIVLGTEPFLYGAFFVIYDFVFLGIKALIFKIISLFKPPAIKLDDDFIQKHELNDIYENETKK